MGFIFYMFILIGSYVAIGLLVAYKLFIPGNPLATIMIIYLWPLFLLAGLIMKLVRKDCDRND